MALLRLILFVAALDGAPTHESVQLPATMSDGSKIQIAPLPVSAAPEPDRRPIYVGLGLVVLAIAFYFNRRARDRFETDRAPSADRDADDLHAAAKEADDHER